MTDFTLKRNDTVPIEVQLTDAAGDPEDLTGDNVRFHMRPAGGTVLVNEAATIVDAANGVVSYSWKTTDTSEAGAYLAEFEVTYNPGTADEYVETYPRDGYLEIQILEDIA